MGGAAVVVIAALFTIASCQIVFEVEPEDVLTTTDAVARFDCTFTTTSPASLSWLHDGLVIIADSRHNFLANGSLQISPTAEEDEGEYTCRITDTITEEVIERSATLTLATILDSFLVSPDSTIVDEDDQLQLFCIHSGSLPAADIIWTLDGNAVESSERISVSSLQLSGTDPPQTSSSLYISSTEPSDGGSYACEARNELLPDIVVTSNSGDVTVIGVPRPPTITEHPSDTIVVPGTATSFSCSANGQPSPTFTWYHNDNLLITTEQVSITTSAGSSTVSVADVSEEEEGEYYCEALNSLGTANSETAELQLAFLDSVFQQPPLDTVAIAGSDVRVDCVSPLSNPSPTISWTRNFAQLPTSRFSVLVNGSLFISSVELSDQTVYHCVATNHLLGVSVTSDAVQLIVLSIPTVTPDTISVSIGQSATFLCEAPGSPLPILNWYNRSELITANTPRTNLTLSTLTLVDIVREDQGEYVCTATYTNGTAQASAMLYVNAPPLFVDPSIAMTIIEGDEVTLPCDTLPDPTLTYTWFFNGNIILLPSDDENGPTLLSNGSLYYTSVVDDMEGTYTCEARNNLGTAEGTVQLTVLVPPSLTLSSSNVTVTEGDNAVLTCIVTGDPIPVLMWYHMETLLADETESTLILEEVVKEDEGEYECVASNVAGIDRAIITLIIYTHPTIDTTPSLIELLIGSTVTFYCTTSGDPTPIITWYNEAGINITTLTDSRVEVIDGGTLVISGIIESDSQHYTCTASNIVGSNSSTVELNVLVQPAVSLPTTITVSQGDPLSLDCEATGNPPPSITWFKDGDILMPINGRVSIINQVVFITSLYSTDEGNYTCVASNSEGSVSDSTLITVLVIPVIHAGVAMVTVNEGDTAVLDCNATGNPPPVVSWFHSSLLIPEEGDISIYQAANDSLVLMNVSEEDDGDYVCLAVNEAGSEMAHILLVVNVAPVVTALETSVAVVEGSDVTLSCTAVGQPTPSVTWLRNGGEVPNDSTPHVTVVGGEGEGTLTISPVGEEDDGVWVCMGSNIAGSNQEFITINVLIPPTIMSLPPTVTVTEGTPHTITCMATGVPTPLISWSFEGVVVSTQGTLSLEPNAQRSDAGIYTCTASNTAGTATSNVTIDIHYPPSIILSPESQTAHLNSFVEFQCMADGNPDPLITWNYQGFPISGAVGNIFTIPSATANDVGTYTCIATNTVDEDTAEATLTVLFPPSSPVILDAMATSSTTISLQWTASTDNGGSPITNYIIEYRLPDDTEFSVISTNANTLSTTINGLTPYGLYELQVRGENIVGRGEPSDSLTVQTHPDAPSEPEDFHVVSFTSSSLSLVWSLPDPLNGPFAVFQLESGPEETFDDDHVIRLLFTTQYVVTGIEQGIIYLLRVRASTISLEGESLWGPYSLLRVLDGETLEIPTLPLPSPSPSPTSHTLTSSPIVGTTVRPSTSTILESTTTRISSSSVISSSSPMFPSPSPSSFSVPSSQVGQSTSTVMSSSLVSTTSIMMPSPTSLPPQQPPSVAPTDLTLSATTVGTITVSWKPPLSGLESIDGYAVIISSQSHQQPSTTLTPHIPTLTMYTIILTNLTSYTEYTVTVATYNEGGLGPLSLSGEVTTIESIPTAPQNVTVTVISDTNNILITWLPPAMPNGIITSYTLTVKVNLTGEEILSLTLPILPSTHLASQSVTVSDLELDSVLYCITVTADTSAGTGPSSEPVYIGTDLASGNDTLTSDEERDSGYYVVRILPSVVGAALSCVAVVIAAGFYIWYCRKHSIRKRRRGIYKFSGTSHGSDFELGTKVNEAGVAREDVETSVYYVKDALDANITYEAGPQVHTVREKKKDGYDDDVDMPDIGDDFQPNEEGDSDDGDGSLMIGNRDALQESPSHAPSERPDSLEFPSLPLTHQTSPLTHHHHLVEGEGSMTGSQDSLSRPTYQPGDYSYAELDAIRARKVQQRAKRFRPPNPESTGYSSGGLMETRIGAVGGGAGVGRAIKESPLVRNGHITPGELAHMY